MREENIRKMSNALLSGATMLAESCPKCNAPLFRFPDGSIKCVACGWVPEGKTEKERDLGKGKGDYPLIYNSLRDLSYKSILKAIEVAQKSDDINLALQLIDRSLSILLKLKELEEL